MKLTITSLSKKIVCLLLFVLCAIQAWATTPAPGFTFTIQNEVQTSDKTLEFDVYLLNTNSSVVYEAAGVQMAITMNAAMLNGGTITPTFVSGYSDMVSAQIPNNMLFDATGALPMVKISPRSYPGWGAGTTISTTAPGTRVCRIRLTNSVAFASTQANLDFQLTGTPYKSSLSYYDHDTGTAYALTLSTSNTYSSTTNPVLSSLAAVDFGSVTQATNTVSGTLSSLGSPSPTEYGFVYSSTNSTPTVSDSKVNKGAASTTGAYSSALTGLTAGTTYYVRAYAINSAGTAYSPTKGTFVAANLAPVGLSYTTPNVYTKGVAITSLNPTVSGTVIAYSVSPTLPAGLTLNTTTGVISGTPTAVSSTADYVVTASNASGSASATVRITVNDVAPSGLNYSTPNVFIKGAVITPLTPTVTGTVSSYSVSPTLPAGLSLNATTGAISGTPTALSAATNYTITASNATGSTTKVIVISVVDGAPSGLNYSTPNVFTKGVAITPLTPTVTGTVSSYSVSPALPAGLALNATTGAISGTPTALSAATNYTITASNASGSITKVIVISVVNPAASSLSYSTPNLYTRGLAISLLIPTLSGATATSYSVTPSLPSGLSMNATTGVISGTPQIVTSAINYTVTAYTAGGSVTCVVSIQVNDIPTVGLSYPTPNVFAKGVSISPLNPTVNGATVTNYSVSPALPAGLSINATTGVISGTPAVAIVMSNYTVTASTSGGSYSFTLSITVNDAITVSPLAAVEAGCEATDLTLIYNLLSGAPTQYQLKFSNQAILAGLSDVAYTALPVSSGGVITFSVPKSMRSGTYTGFLQLKDNAGIESQSYPFTFTVSLSSDYLIAKFDDVIACDNSSYRFIAYQWYKNGVKIEGATKQFYNDPLGLIGTYTLEVTTADGNTFFSCPKTFNITKKSVKVFPNPVQVSRAFSVQMVGFKEKELSAATLAVYDMQGVCVYKSSTVSDINTLQLPSSQVYIGHVTTSQGEDYSFKILVQK